MSSNQPITQGQGQTIIDELRKLNSNYDDINHDLGLIKDDVHRGFIAIEKRLIAFEDQLDAVKRDLNTVKTDVRIIKGNLS